ncbi:hypothetical protein MUN82_08545 [Hymenobacter aerilatus]|uniref:Bestrophin n=1 Tax=Hymenobacter aerilatus TaxID=2932251 RepID=A0A8T9SZ45_9BACT|nr:bestrophin family ion channel [Hymenobacter aerilatus]UOR07135.1 hypothetical protein MUN82_08545 [Hymenobacter aerilatus]
MLLDTKLPVGYILKRIWPDVIRVLIISVSFQLLKYFLGDYLPQIPLQLPTILGSLISLLLAFNLNQSYDRWWEARKMWGAIVNDSRMLVLQILHFVPNDLLRSPTLGSPLHAFAYRQIAWCYSLGQSLRGLDALEGLDTFLSEQDLAYLRKHSNKPVGILALHTAHTKELYQKEIINAFQQVQLDNTVVRYTESMGGAERIKNTVFPASYRQLIYLLIYLFLITLSLGLVETIGFWEIPMLMTIAVAFLLLERTARYLQDPFSNKPTDTPMTAVARTIEINLRQLLEEHKDDIPTPVVSNTFYLM